MAFVVTDNCIQCKDTDCVAVCPAVAFHHGANFLAINPDDCIDCDLCTPECPANAIFQEDELPAGQEQFKALNAELSEIWPKITEVIAPPQDADSHNGTPNKINNLIIE